MSATQLDVLYDTVMCFLDSYDTSLLHLKTLIFRPVLKVFSWFISVNHGSLPLESEQGDRDTKSA